MKHIYDGISRTKQNPESSWQGGRVLDEIDMEQYKARLGDILAIRLGKGYFTYARVLSTPVFAFYDIRTQEIPQPKLIVQQPVFLKIMVSKVVPARGKWIFLANIPLEAELFEPTNFFFWQMHTKRLYIMQSEYPGRSATVEECTGLEKASSWGHKQILSMLRDHFSGHVNEYHEALSLERTMARKW